MDFILKVILAYLLGSVVGGLVVGRLRGGVDIRKLGSGNAGSTNALRTQGLAIIVLSTEPETVLSLADRIIVLKRGAVVREFAGEAISKDRLLEAA